MPKLYRGMSFIIVLYYILYSPILKTIVNLSLIKYKGRLLSRAYHRLFVNFNFKVISECFKTVNCLHTLKYS